MVLLANVEFYNTPDGAVMFKENGKPVKLLTESDRPIIEEMLSVLQQLYPTAFSRLSELYTRYERNRFHFEFKMVHRFIRCNFGEYDQYRFDIEGMVDSVLRKFVVRFVENAFMKAQYASRK